MLKEKNHRFNGRYEELTGDLKHTCPEIDDEERCGRALFWEYSTKQPLFECKWQDLDHDMKYSCRDKKADAAAAPTECAMCKFLGHPDADPLSAAHLAGSAPGSFAPKAEPARAAPLEPEQAQKLLDKQLLDLTSSAPDQKLLNRALQPPVAVPEAAPKGTPPKGSHETTVAQHAPNPNP